MQRCHSGGPSKGGRGGGREAGADGIYQSEKCARSRVKEVGVMEMVCAGAGAWVCRVDG